MDNILNLSNSLLNEDNFLGDFPENIKILNLSNNEFNILPEIPNNIEILDLRNNLNLTRLTNIPTNLKQIYIHNTNVVFTDMQVIFIAENNIRVYYDNPIDVNKIILKSTDILKLNNLQLTEINTDIPETIKIIICENNKFKKLFKLPKNIQELYLNNNKIKNINLSEYEKLTYLQIENNELSDIIFNDNVIYNDIEISNNKLKKLHINKCEKLIAEYNNIQDFNINPINLIFLNLQNNNLQDINLQNMINLQKLNIGYNNLSSINLNDCVKLDTLYIFNNKITDLNLNNNIKLKILYANDNKLTDINLNNNILINTLNLNNNELITLDISKLIELNILYVNNNKLEQLNLNNTLIELYCNSNNLNELYIPDTLNLCNLQYNKFTEFKNLKNLKFLNLNNNEITNFIVENNSNLTNLLLNDNNLNNINLKNLNILNICYLKNNNITIFPTINNSLKYLNLNDNYINEIIDISNSYLQVLKINNNNLKDININNLPITLNLLFCEDNYLSKCIYVDNLKIECNLYDNYIDVLDDEYKQDNTFNDIIISNDTEIQEDLDKNKKSKSSNIKCINPTTFLGDDVNNNNIDIIIVNSINNKYYIYCYNYVEFFSSRHNKIYEWENNRPILSKKVFKEQYTGLFFNQKSYDYAKIYNTFIVNKIKDIKIGTTSQDWVSRFHGRDVELHELNPIKFSDLMLCLDRKIKLTNEQLILKNIELQDLNIHFRKNNIIKKEKYNFIEYESENLYMNIMWNEYHRQEYISNSINKKYGKHYKLNFNN